ncbi:MAG TPA: NADH-quinone oxidoreductase subunit K [Fredinandcohnia sp.]|nr:NADH-quinone oxidoreductase subunit K [Fredinandcohnia sp.]
MSVLLCGAVSVLVAVGIYNVLQRDAIRLVLGFSLLLGAANLFVLQCSAFFGHSAPYVHNAATGTDPLPQVLILTAIAIGFGVTALLIALVLTAERRLETADLDEISRLRN